MSNGDQKLEWLENLLTNLQILTAVDAPKKDILEIIELGLKIIGDYPIYTERQRTLFTLMCESRKY